MNGRRLSPNNLYDKTFKIYTLFCDLSHGSCYGSPPPSKKYLYFSTCPHFVKMQGCTSLENIKTSTDKSPIIRSIFEDICNFKHVKRFPQILTKLQKKTCRLCCKGHDGPSLMALRCYFTWRQPSTVQTRKHIENKSLGNQLKMARDQKTDENPYRLKE